MSVNALEDTGRPSPPTMDAAPPEPQSFVEAAILQTTVQEELAAILASPSFSTSKKAPSF